MLYLDDYVADIKDKKFTIEIVENDDSYAVDSDNISMEVRNDDNAGLILLYSGNNLRVSEADQGAQMLVMLRVNQRIMSLFILMKN